MKNKILTIIILVYSLFMLNAFAYELETHEEMSRKAFNNSMLRYNGDQLLGLLNLSVKDTFTNSEGNTRIIEELIVDGSRFEDNLLPQPRPPNHFFDPLDRYGLFGTFTSSPDFILEDRLLTWGWHPWQRYSYADANKYFYKALTSEDKELRDEYWGKTFETLGHVIHHIQDMAQPDHVRNDQHLTILSLGDPSYYEDYTERLADVAALVQIPYGTAQGPLALHYQNLFSDFKTPREFWTKPGRKGMADFTNHNFVSKDTNFRMLNDQVAAGAKYPNPVPEPETITVPISDPSLMGQAGQALCDQLKVQVELMSPPSPLPEVNCDMDFVQTTVSDTLLGVAEVDDRASSYSIFNKYVEDLSKPISVLGSDVSFPRISVDRVFTLNRFNFNARHQFLIPRAVAYSTGLLNYFFRLRFDVDKRGNLINDSNYRLKGSFEFYIDDIEGKRHLFDSVEAIIGPGGRVPLIKNKIVEMSVPPSGKAALVFKGAVYNSSSPQVMHTAGRVFDIYLGQSLSSAKQRVVFPLWEPLPLYSQPEDTTPYKLWGNATSLVRQYFIQHGRVIEASWIKSAYLSPRPSFRHGAGTSGELVRQKTYQLVGQAPMDTPWGFRFVPFFMRPSDTEAVFIEEDVLMATKDICLGEGSSGYFGLHAHTGVPQGYPLPSGGYFSNHYLCTLRNVETPKVLYTLD